MNGTEHEIIITLTPRLNVSDVLLEEKMFEVLAIVENHATDVALGPVVSVNFDDHSIELAFTAETDTLSGAQGAVSKVMSIIEQHTDPSTFVSAGTCATEPAGEAAYGFALAG